MELNSRFLHKLLSWFTFLTLTDKESIFIKKKIVCVFMKDVLFFVVWSMFGNSWQYRNTDCFSTSSYQWTFLQGAHCEERLRIEIVNLREQLDTRAEENGLSIFIWFELLGCAVLFSRWLYCLSPFHHHILLEWPLPFIRGFRRWVNESNFFFSRVSFSLYLFFISLIFYGKIT